MLKNSGKNVKKPNQEKMSLCVNFKIRLVWARSTPHFKVEKLYIYFI